MRIVTLPLLAVALSACATTPSGNEAGEGVTTNIGGKCNRDMAADFRGQKVSADLGAQIQKATGARSLRWGPPNAAFTMDYREDRVNVMYDDKMIVTDITCG